jgi:hypothetical protein
MFRSLTLATAIIVLSLPLTACGLAETGAAAAAGGASEVQQAKEAKATEERVKKQVEAAVQQATDRQHAAEAESQ